MLVCNVSMRPFRSAIAADVIEAIEATDAPATGNVVFATLVDDPASVGEIVDAYLGEIMLEAASANAVTDASMPAIIDAAIVEAATAIETQSGSTAITDPSFASVKLLMGFEGANGSTGSPGMTDESPSARGNAGINGSAQIDTSQFKFGASSLHPNGGFVFFADSPDWVLSSANSDQFTIECFVRFSSNAANTVIVAQYTTDGTVAWSLQMSGSSASEFQFYYSPNGTFASGVATITSGAGLSTGTWYHLAIDKDATGKIRLYKDGVMRGSATPANSAIFNSSVQLGIGATPAGGGPLAGWIDELRITKGAARYANDSGFTVPITAFPRS